MDGTSRRCELQFNRRGASRAGQKSTSADQKPESAAGAQSHPFRHCMKPLRLVAVLFAIFLLVLSAHRSPAPVIETAETPPPAPAAGKPKPAKPAREKSPTPATSAPAKQPKQFAGTWVGILPWSYFGDTEFRLVVNASETSVTRVTTKWPDRPTARAEISGDTLVARFPGLHGTFEITPTGDGRTAVVHGSAPTANGTAVFRRE